MNKPHISQILFSTLIPSLFLVIIAIIGDSKEIYRVLTQADFPYLIFGFLLANSKLLFTVYVWQKVFALLNVTLNLKEILEIVLSNIFINNVTPLGHVGGEPFILYFLKKKTDETTGKLLSGMIASDIILFSPLFTFPVAAVFLTGGKIFSILFLPLVRRDFFNRLTRKLRSLRIDVKNELILLTSQPSKTIPLILISHLSLVFDFASLYIILKAFGVQISMLSLIILMPIARLADYNPLPGGEAGYQAVLAILLSSFAGIAFLPAMASAIAYSFSTYIFGIVVGYLVFIKAGLQIESKK